MRADKLAKLLFGIGCLGLPWLWAVHLMFWFGKQRRRALGEDDDDTAQQQQNEDNQSGLLDGESYQADEPPADPAEVELEEKKWVRREFLAMVLVFLAWATWIIVFQVLKDFFPSGWLVRGEDTADLTGW
mmetsp:Transcript_27773/g.46078  ORF Transcript_27773/g.46078 Transcript_27773/m.46078 type:complete len:130 (-) Transcript_27773:180-569(-)